MQADISKEEEIEFLDDPTKYKLISEGVAVGGTRQRGLKKVFASDGKLVAWAKLKVTAKPSSHGAFNRRVFYVRACHLEEFGEAEPGTYSHRIEEGKPFSSIA